MSENLQIGLMLAYIYYKLPGNALISTFNPLIHQIPYYKQIIGSRHYVSGSQSIAPPPPPLKLICQIFEFVRQKV
jgi:hypothetical protein